MLDGRLSIKKSATGLVVIEIEDQRSDCKFVTIEMTYSAFGKALVGLWFQNCKFSLFNMGCVGKRKEEKRQIVIVKAHHYLDHADAIFDAFKEFEVDGWVGNTNDVIDPAHLLKRTEEGTSYYVLFIRYV